MTIERVGRPTTIRVGRVYGNWTTLARLPNGTHGDSRWLCECIKCGTTSKKIGATLLHGARLGCKACAAVASGYSRRVPLRDLFRSKVEIRTRGECWPWRGERDRDGYGLIKSGGIRRRATHVAIRLARGEIVPRGREAMHSCDNPCCCNPDHITVGTRKENANDAARKGRLRTGSTHPNSAIDEKRAASIKRLLRSGHTAERIARTIGTTIHVVYGIKQGRTWRHVA